MLAVAVSVELLPRVRVNPAAALTSHGAGFGATGGGGGVAAVCALAESIAPRALIPMTAADTIKRSGCNFMLEIIRVVFSY